MPFGFGIDFGLGSDGTGGSSLTFLRKRPAGDNDLMLKRDDFTGSGEDGRIDERKFDCDVLGGEIDRTWAGAGAGAEALIVGPAGPPRIEVLAKPPPLLRRARLRWKLLADASESLSYVGAGAAMVFLGAAAGKLCGRACEAATAAGMCLFCSAPLGALASTGALRRDAARAMLFEGAASPRILERICGAALGPGLALPRIDVLI